jgi:hypothetical protein
MYNYSSKQITANVDNPTSTENRMRAAPHAPVLTQYLESDGSMELTQKGSFMHL